MKSKGLELSREDLEKMLTRAQASELDLIDRNHELLEKVEFLEKCATELGLRQMAGPPPEYIQGAVEAIVQLYKLGLVKRTTSKPTAFADLMGLCMRALKGCCNPKEVQGYLKGAMEPCGVYNCRVLKFRGELLCESCEEEYHQDPDAFK